MAVRKVIVSDTGKAGYGLKRVTLTTARTPSSWVAPDPMMPRSNHIESLFGSMRTQTKSPVLQRLAVRDARPGRHGRLGAKCFCELV